MNEYEETINVTPTLAQEWLQSHGNKRNRNINNQKVSFYVDLITAGRWLVSGEFAISFDTSGMMLNGHHRLRAVIKSERTVRFVIRRNVSPEVIKYVDTHVARSNKQIGYMTGIDTSEDDSIKVLVYASDRSVKFCSPVRTERVRNQLADPIAKVKAANVRIGGRKFRAGVRAALIAICETRPSACDGFIEALRGVCERTCIDSRATVNLIKWIENRSGISGSSRLGSLSNSSQQLEFFSVTVNAFEQFISGSEKFSVRSDGLQFRDSYASKMIEEIKHKLS